MPETVTEVAVQKALTVPQQAKSVIVVDNETLLKANDVLLRIKDIRKEIDSAFDPIISKAFAAHREACSQKKRAEAPLIEAEGYIKPQIANYMAEQERIKREKEEQLRQEALKAEEERKLQEALQAEKEGNNEEAETILQEETFIPPPIVERTTPKLEGTAIRENWKFRITDLEKIPRMYMVPDLVKIGQIVRALRSKCNIPGIEVYPEKSVSSGRR